VIPNAKAYSAASATRLLAQNSWIVFKPGTRKLAEMKNAASGVQVHGARGSGQEQYG
jgi:hypothetical protein